MFSIRIKDFPTNIGDFSSQVLKYCIPPISMDLASQYLLSTSSESQKEPENYVSKIFENVWENPEISRPEKTYHAVKAIEGLVCKAFGSEWSGAHFKSYREPFEKSRTVHAWLAVQGCQVLRFNVIILHGVKWGNVLIFSTFWQQCRRSCRVRPRPMQFHSDSFFPGEEMARLEA